MQNLSLAILLLLLLLTACDKKQSPKPPTVVDSSNVVTEDPLFLREIHLYYFDKNNTGKSLLGYGPSYRYKGDAIKMTLSTNNGAFVDLEDFKIRTDTSSAFISFAYIEQQFPDVSSLSTFTYNFKYVVHLNTGESDTIQISKDKEGYKVQHYLNNQLDRVTESKALYDTQEFKIYR